MAHKVETRYNIIPRNAMTQASTMYSNHQSLFDIAVSALAGLPIAILVLTVDGCVKFANVEARNLLSFAKSSLGTANPSDNVIISQICQARTTHGRVVDWNIILEPYTAVNDIQTPIVSQDLFFRQNWAPQDTSGMEYQLFLSEFTIQSIRYITVSFQSCKKHRGVHDCIPQNLTPLSTASNPSDHRYNPATHDVLARLHQAVLESTKTIVYLLDSNGKTVFFNKAARKLLGEEAVATIGNDGRKFAQHFLMYNEDFSIELLDERPGARLLSTQQNVPMRPYGVVNLITGDRMVLHADGECLYESGKFIGGLVRIRQHMDAEAYMEQKKSNFLSSFETVCDQLPHIVWRANPEGYATYFNTAWTEVTGQSIDDAMHVGFKDFVHPEDKTKLEVVLIEMNRKALSGREQEATSEVRLKRKVDGMWCWYLLRAKCLMKDGAILAWYGTYTEIHKELIARNRHEKFRNQMTTILQQSAEVNLFSFDTEGRFILVQGADQAMGNVQPQLQHSADEDMRQLAKSPKLIEKVKEILNGHCTSVLDHDVGNRTYRIRLIADTSKEEAMTSDELKIRGVLGLSIDITDVQARAALELENATLQAEERVAQNNSRKKSEFLANMSHEMRTPLAGMIGLIDLLMDTPLDFEQKDYVSNIRFSCNMLLAIVNDVLDFSKVESGRLDIEKVQFNLGEMLRGLKQLLMPSIDRSGLDLVFNAAGLNNMLVLGDPSRIRQILLNLLTNALKFTKEGSVTLTVTIKAKGSCRDTNCKNCVFVTFEVKDTGCGITPEVLAQLFQPFRQGDSSTARLYGGTGLGLTISQNLARLMDGHLELKSHYGEGTTSIFTVPLELSKEKQLDPSDNDKDQVHNTFEKQSKALIDVIAAQTASKMDPPPNLRHGHSSPASLPTVETTRSPSVSVPRLDISNRSHFHVLVVEDNKINQTIALKTIRKLGFTATAVWNGQEALDHLASCLTPPDSTTELANSSSLPELPSIILMDVQMPICDGYAATRIIRTKSPWKDSRALQAIPIVALTASAIQGDLEKCMASGMNDYLAKPVARDIMERMLVKWLSYGDGIHNRTIGYSSLHQQVGTAEPVSIVEEVEMTG